MVPLLLDECVTPSYFAKFWDAGIDAVHIRDRGLLQVRDHTIWARGISERRAIVTINESDFLKLWRECAGYNPGLVIIPSGVREAQFQCILSAVNHLRAQNPSATFAHRYLKMSAPGRVEKDYIVASGTPVPVEVIVQTVSIDHE
jgi:predicted nuclease of predicted toxin-antitoxin system